jgi:hypothetical protein
VNDENLGWTLFQKGVKLVRMAKPGDVASGAFENWLIRKEFDDAKEVRACNVGLLWLCWRRRGARVVVAKMLRDMKARKLKASWREVSGTSLDCMHVHVAAMDELSLSFV